MYSGGEFRARRLFCLVPLPFGRGQGRAWCDSSYDSLEEASTVIVNGTPCELISKVDATYLIQN